jgi:hypothetical protein
LRRISLSLPRFLNAMPAAAAMIASPPALPVFELGEAFLAAAAGSSALSAFLSALGSGCRRRRSAGVGLRRRGVDVDRAYRRRPELIARPLLVCVAISAPGSSAWTARPALSA